MKERRDKILKEIEDKRKELYRVEQEMAEDGILDDVTLLSSIERSLKLYQQGKFTSIRKEANKMLSQLDADRYFELQNIDIAMQSLEQERVSGTQLYKLPLEMMCPYGLPVIIGAPPKNRKTTMALNLAYDAIERGVPSVFATLELTPEHVIRKLLQIRVRRIDSRALDFFEISNYCLDKPVHLEWLAKALNLCAILETNKYTAARLCSVLDRILVNRKAKLVFIDYFQRMRPDLDSQGDTRVGYMQTSRYLTDKCKEMNAVFVVLSQLNQAGEYKETGALTEDAGLALTLASEPNYIDVKVKASRFTGITELRLPVCDVSGTVLSW